jgi:L-threonylcarbamoyladenylate synthase
LTAPAPAIDAAAAALARGEVVAFPTETVYGLGADASNPAAVRRVFELKGRPADHPLIVHLAGAAQLADWAAEVPPLAGLLARRFWPGPLTLILPRAARVSAVVTGGQDTIALRVPSHPVAQALLAAFGGGVAAPSANRHGRVSATTAQHVRDEFGDALPVVLDGGATDLGLESTIVDCSSGEPVLLRPGGIGIAALTEALGAPPAAPTTAAPRAPGTLASHYAPHARLMLVDTGFVAEIARFLVRDGQRVGVLSIAEPPPLLAGVHWIAAPADAAGYAHELYANLRALDAAGCAVIVAERPPQSADWYAINDRLARAAAERPPDST